MALHENFWDANADLKAEAEHERAKYDDAGWSAPLVEFPWPQLDQAALYGLAGEVVEAVAPHTESDRVAVLIQYLIMCGNAIGRGPYHRVEGDRHHLNFFGLLVGATAKARKGTSLGRVRQILEPAASDWLHQRVVSGLSSGEGLIWRVRDELKGPVKTGKGENVKYIETVIDPGVDDKRLLVIEAEFARTMMVIRRDGNTLSPVVRDAWDRGTLAILTKANPAQATGAHISIIGHITTDELRRNLDSTALTNGFANRFLFACVRRTNLLPFGGKLDPQVVLELAARTHQAIEAATQQQHIDFDEAAAALWAQGYAQLSEDQPGLFGAVTARAEPQTMRLATLYAVLDGSPAIALPHLQAALALWRYCLDSARYIFGDALGDVLADEILRLLRSCAPAGMSRTEISNAFGRNRSGENIGSALALLLRHGKARPTMKGGNGAGRPVEIWAAL
jgi:hypothetical protein